MQRNKDDGDQQRRVLLLDECRQVRRNYFVSFIYNFIDVELKFELIY